MGFGIRRMILMLMTASLIVAVSADGAQRCRIRVGTDQDGRPINMERLTSSESQDLAVEVYNAVKKSLVIIKGEEGSGSGSVAEADGAKWIYTNEHVARIGEPLKAVFLDGREIGFSGTIEVSEDRDLARIKLATDCPALKLRDEAPSLDELVFVFGNSDGGGVVTKIIGMVLGVGDKKLEVNAKFVAGNSGSPVLDGHGRIVGIATEAWLRRDPQDWVKTDTRFNDVRRYCTRHSGAEWKQLEWETYSKSGKCLDDFRAYRSFLIPVCFKDKKLVTDYNADEVKAVQGTKALKNSLAKLIRQDKEYLKTLSEFNDTLDLRKKIRPGDMRYPKDYRVNMKYKKLRREILESILERKNALRKATDLLSKLQWPCRRLKDDAEELLEGFRYCCEAYDKINDESLSQIDWHVE